MSLFFLNKCMMQVNYVQEDGQHNATDIDINSDLEESGENSGKNSAFSVPLAALRYVTKLATGIFSRGQKNLDPSCLDSKVESELESEKTIKISEVKDPSDESSSQKLNVIDQCGMEIKEEVTPEAQEVFEAAEALCGLSADSAEESYPPACSDDDNTCSFKHFDTAKDPLDHYFLGAYGQVNAFCFFK